jgi:hypothetical protein
MVGCVVLQGLTGDIMCELMPGTGSGDTDYAVIKVTGFSAVPTNTTVKINFNIKHSQTAGITPSGKIEIYSIRSDILLLLNSKMINFASIGSSTGFAFTSITANWSTLATSSSTSLTVIIRPTDNVAVAGHNSLIIKLPSEWMLPESGLSCKIGSLV